ncbi:hypothetical protein DEO72_LG1g2266 [Vigna unguiculata]|uniref:Uncharacterized protein n=1 Tax=Vigna unguiculata TaxID=3917 RepID=A0A4D6KPM8_VIGUN|nr:hypothetical protein DEO72_LG1g2266 [Vigna unguiculata]
MVLVLWGIQRMRSFSFTKTTWCLDFSSLSRSACLVSVCVRGDSWLDVIGLSVQEFYALNGFPSRFDVVMRATHSRKVVEIGAVDVHFLVLVLCQFGNHFRLEEAIVV